MPAVDGQRAESVLLVAVVLLEHAGGAEGVVRAVAAVVLVLLRQAGLDVTVRDSEAVLLWEKLAFLAPLALVTTHAGAPAGVIRERRRADLESVIDEVAAVAGAAGAPVDPAIWLRCPAEPRDCSSLLPRSPARSWRSQH